MRFAPARYTGPPHPDSRVRSLVWSRPRTYRAPVDSCRVEVWMESSDMEIGPIDIAVIGYGADAPMTGEAAPLLVDLVERGIIRVLDVMFVMKNEDGTFSGFDARDLTDKGVGD